VEDINLSLSYILLQKLLALLYFTVGKGQVGGRPRALADIRGTSTYFQCFKIMFLSKNLKQNMLKNVLFFEKKCKKISKLKIFYNFFKNNAFLKNLKL